MVIFQTGSQALYSGSEAFFGISISCIFNLIILRNGPGKYEFDEKKYNHLFDGHSCVHKFEIKDGKVFYFNKLLETDSFKKTSTENRLYPQFGTSDLCSTLFSRVKSLFYPHGMDNTNVNIVPFSNQQLYALTETNSLVRVDPATLDVIKTLNINDYISSSKSSNAHPHVENDGSWINVGMNTTLPGYEFVKYDGKALKDPVLENILENGKIINTVPSSTPSGFSYFHSFGVTENYIIFLEQSLKLTIKSLVLNQIKNNPFVDSLYMEPSSNTRIHLINKTTGQITNQKYHTDPLFVFHHINAYEILQVYDLSDLVIYGLLIFI